MMLARVVFIGLLFVITAALFYFVGSILIGVWEVTNQLMVR